MILHPGRWTELQSICQGSPTQKDRQECFLPCMHSRFTNATNKSMNLDGQFLGEGLEEGRVGWGGRGGG
jgi:hypothetical protein